MQLVFIILIEIILFLIGYQLWYPDLLLLSGNYNYKVQRVQFISFGVLLIAVTGIGYDVATGVYLFSLFYSLLASCFCYFIEWLLTRLKPHHRFVSWGYRLFFLCVFFIVTNGCFQQEEALVCTPFLLWGILLRNSPLGIIHGKDLALSSYMRRRFKNSSSFSKESLTRFPFCGCQHSGKDNCQEFVVTQFGIEAGTRIDQTIPLQALLDKVGTGGGGRIFFPAGKYYFQPSRTNFLTINYSNIEIAGEIDSNGNPLAELISMSSTLEPRINPWISPFFITTGEKIQPSNIFFGLQFQKEKKQIKRSSSLSDPGSDGSLLEPEVATFVTACAQQGETMLKVQDALLCGRYVMLGMYNTSADGNLIKDILGVDALRPEWTSANRAGVEKAPSFQWLLEIKHVIDQHTIELTRPLIRDIDMIYAPVLYNVPMLEHVVIRDLKISSAWNGLFHHHGLPLYYSVEQSQEMDYGWNAINMKRVAHGIVNNVHIRNFTNPLYVMDSRNISVGHILIDGYDGHQGLKIYQHACDNLFYDIEFRAHFADMMGGEGNAYANVFHHIKYLNPLFNPVGFDFHGFSEGPMSPPAYNIFDDVEGFAHIQSAAGIDMLPGCAQHNRWVNIVTEGEKKGTPLFLDLSYKPKTGLFRYIHAAGYTVAMALRSSRLDILSSYRQKLRDMDAIAIDPQEHKRFFVNAKLENVTTTCRM